MTAKQLERLNELESMPEDQMTEADFEEMEQLAELAMEAME